MNHIERQSLQIMSFFILVIVFSGVGHCQDAMPGQRVPSNYTFPSTQSEIITTNCNVNKPINGFITCHHPSVLTDSVIGGPVFSDDYYYSWNTRIQTTRLQVLFTFPSEINLTGITLYYYSYFSGSSDTIPDYGLPRLLFFTVEDDFVQEFRRSVAGTGRPLILDTGPPEEGETVGVNKTKQFSIDSCATTRKVVMERGPDSINFNFALSEIKFSGNIVRTPTIDTTTCITTTDTSTAPSQTSKTSAITIVTTDTSVTDASTTDLKTSPPTSGSITIEESTTTFHTVMHTTIVTVTVNYCDYTNTQIPTKSFMTTNPTSFSETKCSPDNVPIIALIAGVVVLFLIGLTVINLAILLKYRKPVKDKPSRDGETQKSIELVYDLPNTPVYDTIPEPESIKIAENGAYGPLLLSRTGN